jgi:Asp-tRNA(Asn)/Glu-tRNA(Gln) amidotransferase C subunit
VEEQIKKLNAEYGLGLSQEEIELVARQAAKAEQLFRLLQEVDLTNVMPILKLDRKSRN